MEATGIYGKKLAVFLFKNGYKVSVVNPAKIKGFGQSELTRNKTDQADAKLIARFCQKMSPDLWCPEEQHIEQLRDLVKRLETLKKMQQQEENRLETVTKEVQKIIRTHIKFLEKEIEELQLRIKKLINDNDDLQNKKKLLQSIPGVGEATIAVILAYIGQPKKFRNAKQLAAYVGLNPKQRKSGSSVNGRTCLSKIGNVSLRKALFFPAMVARRHNPIIKKFCDNLAEAGKSKMLIIGAAMRKLLHIIYGVLKNELPFNGGLVLN